MSDTVASQQLGDLRAVLLAGRSDQIRSDHIILQLSQPHQADQMRDPEGSPCARMP